MTAPVIIITGSPDWLPAVSAALHPDYTVIHLPQPGQYMKTLIERRAALVLVDGHAPDWSRWTSVPRSSPATRRIPIVLISADNATRAASAVQGADLALEPAALVQELHRLVPAYARLPDPAQMAQLDCDCQSALPDLARAGIARFNAGEYYAQHDLLEELWVATAGPVRDLYRAILQVGVAYYQIERGNYRGALKMLQRSVQWLLILPDVCQGVDVRRLREESFRVRAELERLGEARFAELDRTLIGGVHLVTLDENE
ncbi:MAG: DUF309 domain-containing protein [Anaerolineae bacterium]|jgi:hypothetical protein|nr:DUF309 domain-containing protein [Anaerolineae bacterium]